MARDADDLRLPIKLDSTSNGEYEPIAPSDRLRWVQRTALERAVANARKLGIDRRAFLRSSCGAATVLLTMNEVLGCGGSYDVPKEAAFEPDAAKALEGKELIFDVQTHHVSPDRKWWETDRPNIGSFLKTTPQAKCGNDGHWTQCFSRNHLYKEVFLDSDTELGVLSALWGSDDINAILVDEMAATRARISELGGPERLRIHGGILPKTEPKQKTLERMRACVDEWKIAAWKLYPVWSSDQKGYRLDDPETGLWAIREGVKMGVPVFAVHKGLPLPGHENAFTSAIDVGAAAKAEKGATILVYHSGFDPSHVEGPYDAKAEKGVDTLIRGVVENGVGKGGNVYAELGSVWRELMKSPDQAAHVLGKLLVHLGEDRILWGTDSIWYGSPQDQIQAFRAFQISSEFQEKYRYPALTPAIKAKIFGLNAARVYGVDVEQARKTLKKDAIALARAEYANDPAPSFETYGPKTKRELFSWLASGGH